MTKKLLTNSKHHSLSRRHSGYSWCDAFIEGPDYCAEKVGALTQNRSERKLKSCYLQPSCLNISLATFKVRVQAVSPWILDALNQSKKPTVSHE